MKNANTSYERYQRQITLKQFGETGQQKLSQAKVLVIGAGGLGCPVLQYLAAAGVGTIGIADGDVVSISNLHRQPLYSTFDIGYSKAEKATQVLKRINPDIDIKPYNIFLSEKNALELIGCYEIIIDATDNFAARYLINDACVLLGKSLVYGAVSQFEGQVAVFNARQADGSRSVNYRDMFTQMISEGETLNCEEAGVLGVLPGIIGTMQANEAIKIITGIGKILTNTLLTYNSLNNQVYEISLTANEQSRAFIPVDAVGFEATNYNQLCSARATKEEIDPKLFDEMIRNENVQVIDVREYGELPVAEGFFSTRIPLSVLNENLELITGDAVVFFCQSGKRSLQAAHSLLGIHGDAKKIYSLQGGIIAWIKYSSKQ